MTVNLQNMLNYVQFMVNMERFNSHPRVIILVVHFWECHTLTKQVRLRDFIMIEYLVKPSKFQNIYLYMSYPDLHYLRTQVKVSRACKRSTIESIDATVSSSLMSKCQTCTFFALEMNPSKVWLWSQFHHVLPCKGLSCSIVPCPSMSFPGRPHMGWCTLARPRPFGNVKPSRPTANPKDSILRQNDRKI